ncbi:MAG: lysophospholipid acyltransferase family protein, partial [Chthoniobacterales bacterium]|nr:lysophospholipid acyltransferase family protein [Chthoniobacterales bacterium]
MDQQVKISNTKLPPPWKTWRYRLEFLALSAAAALVPKLPYTSLDQLASWLGNLVFALDLRGRSIALENLRCAFANSLSPENRELIARQSYHTFAKTMLCLFWSPSLSKHNYHQWIRVEGLDSDPVHKNPNAPGIYFLGHFSNFEWLSLYTAYILQPGILIAQKFKNSLLNSIFDSLRSSTGHVMIPRERAIVRMLKILKNGGKVGAAADLSIDPRLGAIPIRCFGLWTAASPLAPTLNLRTGAPLFFVDMIPDDDGGYTVRLHPRLQLPTNAGPREIAQICWDILESRIRKNPELWLWSYKQWRFRPASAPKNSYPSYANTA